MEAGLVKVWWGKGEHRGKLKLVVLYCFVLLVLHMVRGRNLQAEGDQPSWEVPAASKQKV